jgi:hypothetical protein
VERLRPAARALSEHLGVLAGFSALTVALTWPLAANLGTHTVDVGVDDPLFYTRMVRHFLAWMAGQRTGLLDVDFFWPHPEALTTNDISLGLLYGALPFRPFTGDLLTLVNLGFLFTFVLTGHATWLLAKELTGSRTAAWLGGVAFAFCLFRFHQFDHQNVLQTQWGVYALYAVLVLRRRPGPFPMLGLSGALFLHGTASMNIALYSVFALALFGLYLVVETPAAGRPRFLAWAVAGCLLTGAAVYPLYKPYLAARERTGMKRDVAEVQAYSGRIEQLAGAPKYNRLYGPTQGGNMGSESMTFPGVTVLAFALLGLALSFAGEGGGEGTRRRYLLKAIPAAGVLSAAVFAALLSRALAACLVLGLFAAALVFGYRGRRRPGLALALLSIALLYQYAALGPQVLWGSTSYGPGLWDWLTAVPGYSWVRTPARFVFETQFALAVLAALGLTLVSAWFRAAWAPLALSALALAGVLVEFNCAPLQLRRMRTLTEAPPLYRWLAEQPGRGAVLELPAFHLYERYRMYFSTLHDRPTVDGESGYLLPVMEWIGPRSFDSGRAAVHLERLRAAGLEFVVLHRDQLGRSTERYREILAAAGGTREQRFGADEVWRMPVAARVEGFSPQSVLAVLGAPRPAPAGLSVELQLTPRGDSPVFEYRARRLFVRLAEAPEISTSLHLSPPLLHPGLVDTFPVTLETRGKALPSPCTVEVVDDEGKTWERTACSPPALTAAKDCRLELLSVTPVNGTSWRVGFRIQSAGTLGGKRLVAGSPEDHPPSNGTGLGGNPTQLASVLVQAGAGQPVRAAVMEPGQPPLCEVSFTPPARPLATP